MGAKTEIAWTDSTWNPVEGCTKVSAGCANCYAARMASRFSKAGEVYEGLAKDGNWTGQVRLRPDRLDVPLHWRKPKRIFVNSMSDLFHEDVPEEFIHHVWTVMRRAEHHTFLVLTKRPERMASVVGSLAWASPTEGQRQKGAVGWQAYHYGTPNPCVHILPNVWLGVSVEDQAAADERIPWLLRTPAAVRFVSAEPLLGPVNLDSEDLDGLHALGCGNPGCSCGDRGIDWLISGGETGPGARPAHPWWFRSLQYQCQDAGIPYFHKQNGEWAPWIPRNGNPKNLPVQHVREDGLPYVAGDYSSSLQTLIRVGKRAAGRLLDGQEHNAFPEAR